MRARCCAKRRWAEFCAGKDDVVVGRRVGWLPEVPVCALLCFPEVVVSIWLRISLWLGGIVYALLRRGLCGPLGREADVVLSLFSECILAAAAMDVRRGALIMDTMEEPLRAGENVYPDISGTPLVLDSTSFVESMGVVVEAVGLSLSIISESERNSNPTCT